MVKTPATRGRKQHSRDGLTGHFHPLLSSTLSHFPRHYEESAKSILQTAVMEPLPPLPLLRRFPVSERPARPAVAAAPAQESCLPPASWLAPAHFGHWPPPALQG